MECRKIQQIPIVFLASLGPCLFAAFQVAGKIWLHKGVSAKFVDLLFLQSKGCWRYWKAALR